MNIDREKLAFTMFAHEHSYYKARGDMEEMRNLWEFALKPPPDDPMWNGVHERWLERADALIAFYNKV